MTFDQFFKTAIGYAPHDFQRRPTEDSACQSRLIEIPIPQPRDKTAAVVLAWLWTRTAIKSEIRNPTSTALLLPGPAADTLASLR